MPATILKWHRATSVLIAFSFCVPWPSAARAEDKVSLRLNVSAGQVWTFDRTVETTISEQAKYGNEQQNGSSKIRQHLTGKCEVLAVQNGLPSRTKSNVVNNRDGRTETNGQLGYKPVLPLFGQDDWVSNEFKGQLDHQTSAALQTNLVPDISIYPDHEVAVGDEWKGDPQAVAKQFNIQFPKDTAVVKMKLVSLQKIAGQPVAEIKVSATADLQSLVVKSEPDPDMPTPGDPKWTLTETPGIKTQIVMEGTSLLDLHSGIPLKTTIKCTITMNGSTQGFQAIQIKGTGTMDISSTAALAPAGNGAAPAPLPPKPPVPNRPARPQRP